MDERSNHVRAGIDAADPTERKGRKKRSESKFKITPLKILATVVAGYVLFSFGQVYWQAFQLDQEILRYEQEKQELVAEREELEAEIEEMDSAAFIERQARQRLGLVKPGETVIMPAAPGETNPLREPDVNEILY